MRNCETLARSSHARRSTAEIVTHVWGLQWPCLPMAHTWEPGNKWCGIKVWGKWKEWSDCTRHCGGGSWLRTPHRALPLAQRNFSPRPTPSTAQYHLVLPACLLHGSTDKEHAKRAPHPSGGHPRAATPACRRTRPESRIAPNTVSRIHSHGWHCELGFKARETGFRGLAIGRRRGFSAAWSLYQQPVQAPIPTS